MKFKNGVQYPVDQRLLQKKTANALDRLDELEKALPNIVAGTNNALQNLQNQHQTVTEILDALIEILGPQNVQNIMAANRQKRAEDQAAAEKKGIEDALAKGQIKVAEVISEPTIIVGEEFNKEGVSNVPGRVQVSFLRVAKDFQDQIRGKGVGVSFDIPQTGGKFVVKEIYDVVPPEQQPKPEVPAAAAPEAAPAEAPAAAPAAATADAEVAPAAETATATEPVKQ